MAKTTRCKDDNDVIQILEAHSFASCWKMYEWLDRIHRSRLNRILDYASFRIFLPFHAELTVLARPISIRLDLVDVLSGTTRPGFEHDHLSAHSRIHTRTFRVRACAQISARQRMHGTGCNSSWTARVEIIKPARRADNDFDPINSAFRALPPLRCHVNGKRMGPSCERSNIWKEDGTIV